MNTGIFISSFILGIGGSLHCLGMCGPLALAVPYPGRSVPQWLSVSGYYLAKALAYGFMGAFAGLLGKGFFLMDWQQGLSVAAGILMILMVGTPLLKRAEGVFPFQKQFASVYHALQRNPRWYHYFLLGLLNGFLPCGLVYTALAAATVSGGMLQGFAAMFLFGLGTAPVLVTTVLFKRKLNVHRRRILRPLSLVLSISVGLLLILRGLNLGIPYVSPEVGRREVKSCCHRP